jgi:UDP-N-acetylglucosamine 3-dehydrogenase
MFDLKVGVIGAGSMGRNHVRVLSEIANLVGVCDISEKSAMEIGSKFNVPYFTDLETFIKETGVEAVCIATPTTHHVDAAITCLEDGIDLLVEKPIAATVEDGKRIIDTAKKNGRTLAVGMIERHNPVVKFTREMIEKGEFGRLVTIMSRRVSNFPVRISDVGVITDIGVHDIDVLRYLSGSEATSVYALGGKVKSEKYEDHATILISFANGMEGVVEVSWLTPMKLRKITITGVEGVAEMDYVDQELMVSTSSTFDKDKFNLWKIPQIYDMRRIRVRNEEPLKRELVDFLEAIVNKKAPLVTGEDGLRSLQIAKAAEESIRNGRKVDLQ